MTYEELTIEGRNAVSEAFRSGRTVDKLFVGLMVALILINIYNIYRFMV